MQPATVLAAEVVVAAVAVATDDIP